MRACAVRRPVADWAKAAGVGQFLFISSAGIYKPTEEPPHVEGVTMPARPRAQPASHASVTDCQSNNGARRTP